MKYLLDTHIILWALIEDSRLNERVKEIILDNNNEIYYSTVSVWEVEIKHQKEKSFTLTGEQLAFLVIRVICLIFISRIDMYIN